MSHYCDIPKNGQISQKTSFDPTSLVWSSIYDIGVIYPFVDNKTWESIEVTIRKAIKLAGLDTRTDSHTIYQLSLKVSPKLIATKQIVQLGVKATAPSMIGNRNLIKQAPGDEFRPFRKRFLEEFNRLPNTIRKDIAEAIRTE